MAGCLVQRHRGLAVLGRSHRSHVGCATARVWTKRVKWSVNPVASNHLKPNLVLLQ